MYIHGSTSTKHWCTNWGDITSCIHVVEAKIVKNRVKRIDIPACFLLEKFGNGIFIPNMLVSKIGRASKPAC